jgi:hypothetical protein
MAAPPVAREREHLPARRLRLAQVRGGRRALGIWFAPVCAVETPLMSAVNPKMSRSVVFVHASDHVPATCVQLMVTRSAPVALVSSETTHVPVVGGRDAISCACSVASKPEIPPAAVMKYEVAGIVHVVGPPAPFVADTAAPPVGTTISPSTRPAYVMRPCRSSCRARG